MPEIYGISYNPETESPVYNLMHGVTVITSREAALAGVEFEVAKEDMEIFITMNTTNGKFGGDLATYTIFAQLKVHLYSMAARLYPYQHDWLLARHGIGLN